MGAGLNQAAAKIQAGNATTEPGAQDEVGEHCTTGGGSRQCGNYGQRSCGSV